MVYYIPSIADRTSQWFWLINSMVSTVMPFASPLRASHHLWVHYGRVEIIPLQLKATILEKSQDMLSMDLF